MVTLYNDPETGRTVVIGDDPRVVTDYTPPSSETVYTPGKPKQTPAATVDKAPAAKPTETPAAKPTTTNVSPAKDDTVKKSTGDTFQPDFTKSNPYEGAPEDYIKKVNKSFVPTVENPLPPFTGQAVDAEKNVYLDDKGKRVTITRQDSADLFAEGINARAQAVSRELFEKDYVELKDGQWMAKTDFNKLSKENQKIAKEKGYDVLRRTIDAEIDSHTWDYEYVRQAEEQQAALKDLKNYKRVGQVNPITGQERDVNYNIVDFLRDNPGKETTLRKAGFSDSDINLAKTEAAKPLSLEDFSARYYKKQGWQAPPDRQPEITANRAMNPEKYEEQKKAREEYLSHMKAATDAYVNEYGKGALASTGVARVSEFFFTPARALRPEVAVDDITAAEWAIGAGQVALLFAGGIASKTLSPLTTRISAVGKMANAAGKANAEMKAAVSTLNKTEMGSLNYSQVAAKAQKAIQTAKVADEKFIAELENSALSKQQIKQIEKLSRYKGIASTYTEAQKAEKAVTKAWKAVEKTKPGTEKYAKKLNELEQARFKLTDKMSNLEAKLNPRSKMGEPAGYDKPIEQASKKVSSLNDELRTIEKEIRNEPLSSRKQELHNRWNEVRDELNVSESDLQALQYAKAKGYPAPATERYLMRWSKDASKTDDLFKDLENYLKTDRDVKGKPLNTGRGGTAVKEKVEVKARAKEGQSKLKLEPEYEKPKVKPAEKPKLSTKTSLKTKVAPVPAREQPDRVNAVSTTRLSSESNEVLQPATAPVIDPSTVVKPRDKAQPGITTFSQTVAKSGTSTEPIAETGTETDPGTKPEVKPEIKTRPEPGPEPEPGIKSVVKPGIRTPSRVKGTSRGKVGGKFPARGSGMPAATTKNNDKSVQVRKGSIAWEQGKLDVDKVTPGAETVYKYAEPPRYKVRTSVGRPPKGFVKTAGRTPQETLQTIGGPVKHTVNVNMGITSAKVEPNRGITFSRNTGITGSKPSISKREGRLPSSRRPQITPRRPRIRR